MELPDALKYSASHSTIRTNRFRLVPQGSDSVSPNGTVRVRLPEKSLVRLSSLSAYFTATVSGLNHDGAGTTWVNALIPASYKFFRSVRFYVGGQIASGGLYAQGAFSGTYTDGIVVDYTSTLGRISVGGTDGLAFYNGGVANTELMRLSSSGNLLVGSSSNPS